MDFPLPESAYKYRPLKWSINIMRGWDVVSLQYALEAATYSPGPVDGWFGSKTDAAVRAFQGRMGLTKDGVAGILTQRALCLQLTPIGPWPKDLDKGLYEYEGGFQLGNHSSLYPNDSRDFSVVQDNLPEADRATGFDSVSRIKYYFDMLVQNYTRYWKNGQNPHVKTKRRAWELAVGWWNRPAWTDKLANGGTLTPEQSAWIEGYIDRITTYVQW